jgi:hypothetical protein
VRRLKGRTDSAQGTKRDAESHFVFTYECEMLMTPGAKKIRTDLKAENLDIKRSRP